MALRAKKPVSEPARFNALIYGKPGAGKTHFCCSIPEAYYIETENLRRYAKYVKLLEKNNSVIAEITSLEEIIEEVTSLMRDKHQYKTLIIDSISKPYNNLCDEEAERLKKGEDKEGVGYAKHTVRPKRLINKLCKLLLRSDMNIIVIAQAKSDFNNPGTDTFDVAEKISYDLGCVMEFRMLGDTPMAFIHKTKYEEFPKKQSVNMKDGYAVLKQAFGEETFLRESIPEKFASEEQVSQLKRFVEVLKISDEIVAKWFTASKCTSFEEMNEKDAQKYIDACNKKLTTKGE